jgi:hypothetical protein
MQNQNEKQTVKKPSPEQSGQSDMQQKEQQQADKKVTGQQHTGNNDGAPTNPMKNMPNKNQQQDKNQQKDKNQQQERNQEDMGSGKRQDDN